MSAASALQAARDAGIGLHVDGVYLVQEASAPPHGVEPTGHVWLHSRCWPSWHSMQSDPQEGHPL
ncbi:MAG: hypothetical protein WBO55_19480 [Rhizobiaceae bacterium]